MLRLETDASSIVLRLRSGRQNGSLNDLSQRNWRLMRSYVNMYRSAWRAKYMTLTVVRLTGPGRRRSRGEINRTVGTESGSMVGHLNKLLIGCS